MPKKINKPRRKVAKARYGTRFQAAIVAGICGIIGLYFLANSFAAGSCTGLFAGNGFGTGGATTPDGKIIWSYGVYAEATNPVPGVTYKIDWTMSILPVGPGSDVRYLDGTSTTTSGTIYLSSSDGSPVSAYEPRHDFVYTNCVSGTFTAITNGHDIQVDDVWKRLTHLGYNCPFDTDGRAFDRTPCPGPGGPDDDEPAPSPTPGTSKGPAGGKNEGNKGDSKGKNGNNEGKSKNKGKGTSKDKGSPQPSPTGGSSATKQSDKPNNLPKPAPQGIAKASQPKPQPSPFYDGKQYKLGSYPVEEVAAIPFGLNKAGAVNWLYALPVVAVLGGVGYGVVRWLRSRRR